MTAGLVTVALFAAACLIGCFVLLVLAEARDRADRAARNSSAVRYRREAGGRR